MYSFNIFLISNFGLFKLNIDLNSVKDPSNGDISIYLEMYI